MQVVAGTQRTTRVVSARDAQVREKCRPRSGDSHDHRFPPRERRIRSERGQSPRASADNADERRDSDTSARPTVSVAFSRCVADTPSRRLICVGQTVGPVPAVAVWPVRYSHHPTS